MAEFDDKLNSLLSNPDAMSQIMQLAQSLSGDRRERKIPSPGISFRCSAAAWTPS